MPIPTRPRRSLLFMPGANARALEKSRELPADGLIFDLEDAVAPDAKAAARAAVAAAVGQGGYGRRELVLRVNALDSEWGEGDIAAVAGMAIDAVLLPKVESAERVRDTMARLDRAGAPAGLAVWCMIETPRGVLAAAEIAGSSPRVAALVMGTSDLTKDLQARETPDRAPLLTSLGLVLLAARAHGLAALWQMIRGSPPSAPRAACSASMARR
jgi:citrate lyase subunit beta/citryl-CoA lyase